MSDDDTLLTRAFATGASNVSILKVGRKYIVHIAAWRDLESRGDAHHTEHASVEGEGRTPDLALREALAKCHTTPAIEVREIHRNRALGSATIVPAEVADRVTRIKGLTPAPASAPALAEVIDVTPSDETGS